MEDFLQQCLKTEHDERPSATEILKVSNTYLNGDQFITPCWCYKTSHLDIVIAFQYHEDFRNLSSCQ